MRSIYEHCKFINYFAILLVQTYNVDFQVPLRGTATAFLCGVKANRATIAVDERVEVTRLRHASASPTPDA